MKKNLLFMSVLASLFMAGCAELNPNEEGNDNGEVQTSYLSVNLVSTDATDTRAANGYEDGKPEENKITKVRFYFFTESGAPSNVKMQAGSYVNYYDWTPGENDQIQDTNDSDAVESKLNQATLVINTGDGDKLPRQIVALLNPTENIPDGSRTLSQLRNLTNDYAQNSLTTSGKFVMFNSVYAKDGNEICAVPIEAANLCSTSTDAINHPVNIYVERNVAKVEVDMSAAGFSDGMLALNDADSNPLTVEGEQVYLKVNGWRLTAETNCGRLSKDFDLEWLESTATKDWVNNDIRHRSCWAVNAPGANNVYYSYNEIPNGSLDKALYTNENAEDITISGSSVNLNRTKVIISGTLYKKDAEGNTTPFTIVRHMGAHFADAADADESKNFAALKRNILRQLMTNGFHYYYETTEEGKTVRKSIAPEDLQIKIAPQQDKEDSKNNCYVYTQLTTTAEGKKWYDSLEDEAQPLSAATAEINAKLANTEIVDKALVWNSGMTYYYYEIIHHGTGENATKGVVRNHWYKTKVTKIAGLGTPVYDPTQKIYPEKPNPKEYYIAAQINVLSWHIVNNNYELVW